jgi:uncharacterized spore protein YtfJ
MAMPDTEFLPQLADRFTAKRVFSDPIQEDGVTIITAAEVRGGGGMRDGVNGSGGRAGMGVGARPVGAYVMQGSRVKWKPAFDLSRVVFRGQIILLSAVLVAGWVLSSRLRAR